MTKTPGVGRDGRSLVPTRLAAYSLGIKPDSFRSWARRHGVRSAANYRPSGATGQAVSYWDLADLTDAIRAKAAKAG